MTKQVRQVNEYTPDSREMAETINLVLSGRSNATGEFTLRPNASTTPVRDNLFQTQQVPVLVPLTASAAASPVYISSRGNGEFIVSHIVGPEPDRRFAYVRAG